MLSAQQFYDGEETRGVVGGSAQIPGPTVCVENARRSRPTTVYTVKQTEGGAHPARGYCQIAAVLILAAFGGLLVWMAFGNGMMRRRLCNAREIVDDDPSLSTSVPVEITPASLIAASLEASGRPVSPTVEASGERKRETPKTLKRGDRVKIDNNDGKWHGGTGYLVKKALFGGEIFWRVRFDTVYDVYELSGKVERIITPPIKEKYLRLISTDETVEHLTPPEKHKFAKRFGGSRKQLKPEKMFEELIIKHEDPVERRPLGVQKLIRATAEQRDGF